MAESVPKFNSGSHVIQCNENEFNVFQTKIKTEWFESGFIGENLDDFDNYSDDLDNYSVDLKYKLDYLKDTTQIAGTYNNEEMETTFKSEPMSSIATLLKKEYINDTSCFTKETNISESNSQEWKNSNLIVSSSYTKKINTNQSDGDSVSKHEILLTSKVPISSQTLKINHNCSEYCAWCRKSFAVLDNPHHIGRLRNIETQNAFLKIESSLDILSCICDRCWNFLKKTHQLQKTAQTTQRHTPHVSNNVTKVNVDNVDSVNDGFRIENATNVNEVDKESGTENLDRDDEKTEVKNKVIVDGKIKVRNMAGFDEGSEVDNKTKFDEGFGLDNTMNKSVNHFKHHNRHSKKKKHKKRKQPLSTCSVHNCFKCSIHPISSDEYVRINQIISQFDFCNIILVESQRKKSILMGMPPLSLCEEHLDMVNVLTTCQLCGNKLNGHLDSKEWKMHDEWNEILKCNNIPLILKPGMFICTSCQNCISKCNTLSPNILEDFRQNVKKRNDACRKSFGCIPQVNIPNIYQESNVDPLNHAFNKVDSPTKIKFSEPLTTSTYYFKPYNSEHHSKSKSEEKIQSHVNKVLDILTVPEIKSTKNTNLNCYNNFDPRKLKLKLIDEEMNSITADSLLSDVHKKHSKISLSSYLGKGHKKMLTKRTNKIMSLLRIPPYAQSSDKSLKNKHSLAKPTGGAENQILNDNLNKSTENKSFKNKSTQIQNIASENQMLNNNFNNFTKNKSTQIQNFAAENQMLNNNFNNFTKNKSTQIQNVAAEMDANKDLLPLHVCSLLDNNESEISIHFEADKNQSISNSHPMVHKNKLGKTEKTRKCSPVNTNIHSSQNVINIENKEFNQNNSEMATEYSYRYVYHEDESSSDLNEENTNNIAENVVIVKPNKYDQRFSLLNSKNLHHMKPINHSELRKKLRNVVHQRISNGGIKKQKLNNIYELNENESYIYETNNSIEENSIDLNDNKKNVFRHLNTPTISTLFPRTNENVDSNKNDIIDLLSDEDEGIIIPTDTNSMDETSSTDNGSSIHIGRCYSLNQNYSKPLQCKRTLQRVDDFYSSAVRSLSENEILSEDSQEYEILYPEDALNNQSNLNTTHSFSMSEIDSQNTEFAQQHISTNEEIEDLTQSDSDKSDSDNDENVIHIELDESNQHIYENLMTRFNNNSSDILMYLMDNYQMFYNGKLVLSENASTNASNSLNYHLNHLYQLYGDPTMNNTSVSFLPDSSDSTLNDITTTTSATHTPIMVSKLNNSPSTHSLITIISEDEESDT
ncbi:Hypothetical protein CINCED_3A017824 [Cinara cedri]|uniref:Uncharacterized protein n=1 Tax=Cinara cedri TaxID=506608 RepID=A0A5E4M834_9HEMI|nr:Hypothetical protein CINCED_3A017824 [Cinara cedri]